MIDYDFRSYSFTGIDGRFHIVRGCPLTKLEDLKCCLIKLEELINVSEPDVFTSFTALYLENIQVRSICQKILELNGIDPKWLSMDMMLAFVHHTVDQDNNIQPSLIAQINKFQKSENKEPSEKSSLTEYYANILLSLVNLGLAKDLDRAREVASSFPADELEALVLAQGDRLKTPEQKKKEKHEQDLKEAKERFQSQMKNRSFFSGFNPAKPTAKIK